MKTITWLICYVAASLVAAAEILVLAFALGLVGILDGPLFWGIMLIGGWISMNINTRSVGVVYDDYWQRKDLAAFAAAEAAGNAEVETWCSKVVPTGRHVESI